MYVEEENDLPRKLTDTSKRLSTWLPSGQRGELLVHSKKTRRTTSARERAACHSGRPACAAACNRCSHATKGWGFFRALCRERTPCNLATSQHLYYMYLLVRIGAFPFLVCFFLARSHLRGTPKRPRILVVGLVRRTINRKRVRVQVTSD